MCFYCVLVHTCRSVEPLFESSRFDDGLKQLIRETFPEFYPQGLCLSTDALESQSLCIIIVNLPQVVSVFEDKYSAIDLHM